MKSKPVIGITDCSKYANYERWILLEKDIEVVRLGHQFNNFDEIKRCDGIILTGGEDVNPKFYNKPELLSLCHQDDMDERRDEFELNVLTYATGNKLPILGICRGLQIANVFLNGTLIPDIPSTGKPDHAKVEGVDRYHSVSLIPDSILSSITGVTEGKVNSAHHQCVDKIGKGLRVNSVSLDGIVEGLEWLNPQGKPFFLLVQWHPERMTPTADPLTKKIKEYFLNSVKNS